MKSFSILLLLLYSSITLAENCVMVILGGSKNWMTLLPGGPNDLSIDVASEITSQANSTGCEVLTFSNDTEKDFFLKLKKLKTSPYNKPGTTYHFSFADHGTGANAANINDSLVITGMGQYTTYGKLMAALKEDLPKGSHVTFQTNSCWPNVNEAIIANNMENHFDICGGSSTSKDQMSWNVRELQTLSQGQMIGPYGAVGLNYANQYKKRMNRFPSLSDFHFNAKKGDFGNMKLQPGTTTSLAFANFKLNEAKIKTPLINQNLKDTMASINWNKGGALDQFLASTETDTQKQTEGMLAGVCRVKQAGPYDLFLSGFAPLYQSLTRINPENLPYPYKAQTIQAKNFFARNQKNLAKILSSIARERAAFKKKYATYPKEKYKEVEDEWNKLAFAQEVKLADFEFNFRLLQEGQTIQKFLETASKADYQRFQKYLNCENLPML